MVETSAQAEKKRGCRVLARGTSMSSCKLFSAYPQDFLHCRGPNQTICCYCGQVLAWAALAFEPGEGQRGYERVRERARERKILEDARAAFVRLVISVPSWPGPGPNPMWVGAARLQHGAAPASYNTVRRRAGEEGVWSQSA